MKQKVLFSAPLLVATGIGVALLWLGGDTLQTGLFFMPYLLGFVLALAIGVLTGKNCKQSPVWLCAVMASLIAFAVPESTRPVYVIHDLPIPNLFGFSLIVLTVITAVITAELSTRIRPLAIQETLNLTLAAVTFWFVLPLALLNIVSAPGVLPRSFTSGYRLCWTKTLEMNANEVTGLAAGDALYFTNSSETARVDIGTGELVWLVESRLPGEEPSLMLVADILCIVEGSMAVGFDAYTGSIVWERNNLPDYSQTRVAGRNMLLIPDSSSDSHRAWYILLDPLTGNLREVDLPGPPDFVTLSGWIYDDFSGPNVLTAGNGSLLLQVNWGPEGTRPGYLSLDVVHRQDYSHLYGLDEDGELIWHVPTGPWETEVLQILISWDSRTLASIQPGAVTGGAAELSIYSLPDGEMLWQTILDDEMPGQLSLTRELVLLNHVNPQTHNTYFIDAYNRDNGRILWRQLTQIPENGPPILLVRAGNTLVFRYQGGLAGHDAVDGSLLWEWLLPTPNVYAPVTLNERGRVIITLLPQYFSSGGVGYGKLVKIDAETGNMLANGGDYWYGERSGIFSNLPAQNLLSSPISLFYWLQRYPVATAGGYPAYIKMFTAGNTGSLELGRGALWRWELPVTHLDDGSVQLMPWLSVQDYAGGKLVMSRDVRGKLVLSFFEANSESFNGKESTVKQESVSEKDDTYKNSISVTGQEWLQIHTNG